MRFTLTIDCDNDAFRVASPEHEVARILGRLATDMHKHGPPDSGVVRDINGNTTGSYWWFAS